MSVEELAKASAEPRLTDECRGRAGRVLREEARAVGTRNDNPIVGIGELLWDIYPDGRKVAGGAPFNFAFHCHQLGHDGGDRLARRRRRPGPRTARARSGGSA